MPLHGRVALVTGSSRGIGRAIAIALADAGADVAVHYLRRADEGRAVAHAVESRGRRAVALQADVTVDAEVTALVANVEAALGPVDVLVNNAGTATPYTLDELTAARFDATIAANLRSAFLVSQAVVPSMRARKFGRLLFVASVAARVGGIIGPHYAASKAGMLGLMHGYASQLAKEGITANAICPALVQTEMLAHNARARPEILPVGRFGRPKEIAAVAVLLATNGYMTGQSVQVDGGLYPT
jgi:3-oxoacyl-[acyl-carrier protein] reductase